MERPPAIACFEADKIWGSRAMIAVGPPAWPGGASGESPPIRSSSSRVAAGNTPPAELARSIAWVSDSVPRLASPPPTRGCAHTTRSEPRSSLRSRRRSCVQHRVPVDDAVARQGQQPVAPRVAEQQVKGIVCVRPPASRAEGNCRPTKPGPSGRRWSGARPGHCSSFQSA
jgi:hypothetical protein